MKTQLPEFTFFGRIFATVADAVIDNVLEPVALKVADLSNDIVVPSIVKARHDVGMSGSRLLVSYVAWTMVRKDVAMGSLFIDGVLLDLARDYADVALRAAAEHNAYLAGMYIATDARASMEVH